MLQVSESTAQLVGRHATEVAPVRLLRQLRVRRVQLRHLVGEVGQLAGHFVEELAAFH